MQAEELVTSFTTLSTACAKKTIQASRCSAVVASAAAKLAAAISVFTSGFSFASATLLSRVSGNSSGRYFFEQ